jgi:hypothetical protein
VNRIRMFSVAFLVTSAIFCPSSKTVSLIVLSPVELRVYPAGVDARGQLRGLRR